MIIENTTAYINSYAHEGQVIVPSRVMTATPQDETLDLTYSPNFTLKINDSYSYLNVTDNVYVTFDAGSYTCYAYANFINRAGIYVTLQYTYGLTTSYNEGGGGEDYTDVINQILGTNYTSVNNDISDDDALNIANDILYGEQTPL